MYFKFVFQVNAELALPLEHTLMAQLGRHSSQLIKVIQAKGGATRSKMAGIMKYDEVCILSVGALIEIMAINFFPFKQRNEDN